MKPVHLGVTTFNRQDLLPGLFHSLLHSTLRPASITVIDHGYDNDKIYSAIPQYYPIRVDVVTLDNPGGAVAGNWFLQHLPEERIGCSDDVKFWPDTLEKMVNTPGDIIFTDGNSSFSLALIRDSCVKKVGLFDESISPGYLYFEDWDYINRLEEANAVVAYAPTGYDHVGQATLARYTPEQLKEHNRKFLVAQWNYVRKWGFKDRMNYFSERKR